MKKLLYALLFAVIAFSTVLIYSCKKNNTPPSTPATSTTPPTLDANDETSSDDAGYYRTENDQINTDIIIDLKNYSNVQARVAKGSETFQSAYNHPCGCTSPDTLYLTSQKKIIYNFNDSSDCTGRIRSGTITVQLTTGNYWSDVGAVLTFTYSNFSVKRFYDSKVITCNGTKTLKNVNGSSLAQWNSFFQGTDTLKYQERTFGMHVTFNGLPATWNTAYTSAWSYNPSDTIYTYTATGDSTVNSYSNVSAWGTDRFGNPFYAHITSPIVCTNPCYYWQPMSGQFIYNVGSSVLTITFGVNQSGAPYTGVGCPWGYEINWLLSNGTSGILTLQYF